MRPQSMAKMEHPITKPNANSWSIRASAAGILSGVGVGVSSFG